MDEYGRSEPGGRQDAGAVLVRFILVLLFFGVFLGMGVVGVLILAGVIETDSLARRLWSGIIYTLMGVGAIVAIISGNQPSSTHTGDSGGKEYGIDLSAAGGKCETPWGIDGDSPLLLRCSSWQGAAVHRLRRRSSHRSRLLRARLRRRPHRRYIV